jgi:hypothetical protein
VKNYGRINLIHKIRLCDCGSGFQRFAIYDGYHIFLAYVCDKCKRKKLRSYRPDIMEKYKCDEPIEEE